MAAGDRRGGFPKNDVTGGGGEDQYGQPDTTGGRGTIAVSGDVAMKDLIVFVSVFMAWIVLNRWILPYFGVQTCMSGGCCDARCVGEHDRGKSASARLSDTDAAKATDATKTPCDVKEE
jgi:hypothetical protein